MSCSEIDNSMMQLSSMKMQSIISRYFLIKLDSIFKLQKKRKYKEGLQGIFRLNNEPIERINRVVENIENDA